MLVFIAMHWKMVCDSKHWSMLVVMFMVKVGVWKSVYVGDGCLMALTGEG